MKRWLIFSVIGRPNHACRPMCRWFIQVCERLTRRHLRTEQWVSFQYGERSNQPLLSPPCDQRAHLLTSAVWLRPSALFPRPVKVAMHRWCYELSDRPRFNGSTVRRVDVEVGVCVYVLNIVVGLCLRLLQAFGCSGTYPSVISLGSVGGMRQHQMTSSNSINNGWFMSIDSRSRSEGSLAERQRKNVWGFWTIRHSLWSLKNSSTRLGGLLNRFVDIEREERDAQTAKQNKKILCGDDHRLILLLLEHR